MQRPLWPNDWWREGMVTVLNIYADNIRISRHIQQVMTELTGEVDSHVLTVAESNTRFQQWTDQ